MFSGLTLDGTMQPLTQIEELFAEVLQKPEHVRQGFLSERCADNQPLHDAVRSLLQTLDDDSTSILDSSIKPFGTSSDILNCLDAGDFRSGSIWQPGSVIDSYRLLRHLGDGGMGMVYLAEELAPIQRLVAFKLLKSKLASRLVLQQFSVERQTLALMQHPCIPRIFNAGSTPDGCGFLVMEYIDGHSITEFCARRHLTVEKRIALFVRLCEAVSHAHQNGIIHRDIKPSNVLVVLENGIPSPRLIDFGIAGFLSSHAPEIPIGNQALQFWGTIDYMSPEQTMPSRTVTDRRSDIYSLGVLLYELLTSTTPLSDFRSDQTQEKINALRHRDASRPSELMENQSDCSQTQNDTLDHITLKCLARCPDQRYQTVEHLIDELSALTQYQHHTNINTYKKPKTSRWSVSTAVGTAVSLVLTLLLTFSVSVTPEIDVPAAATANTAPSGDQVLVSVNDDVFRQIAGVLRENGVNTGTDSIVIIQKPAEPGDHSGPDAITLVQNAGRSDSQLSRGHSG